MKKSYTIKKEAGVFDKQAMERTAHGFVPDLRRLTKVDWFYNNVWRDPEFVKIQWMPRINNIIKHAKESGTRTLEAGCGLGMLSLELARNGLYVLGIDISPESIAIAEKYKEENPYMEGFGSLEYICENILNLELAKDKFVICEEMYSDAFIDKLIGGLRGENKYELARFLKFLDTYMIDNKLLPPTSLELVAQKI